MVGRRILRSHKELIERLKKDVDTHWDDLSDWEQRFLENMIELYDQYGSNMFISDNQVNRLIEISEKIL